MNTANGITLVAPCGINCGDCGAYRVKDDLSLREVLAAKLQNWNGVHCPGCRPIEGNCQFVDGTCETYSCVTRHQVDFCFKCPEFPCAKLNPAADKASILPHNIKLFNLCCIQQQGLTNFLEKSSGIRQRYFQGKMSIGKGPQLE